MKLLSGEEAAKAVLSLAHRYESFDPALESTVAGIVKHVRTGGDAALLDYAHKFDGLAQGASMRVSEQELQAAIGMVSADFIRAIETAAKNIRNFAEWQLPRPWFRSIHPGLRVGQAIRPLESVGCYAPGGRYPLPSTVLMTVIPAQVAGVPRIAVASPRPAPETLAAAALIGVTEFYRIGGSQAIAAFAYGTESIPRVNKIVGPGNIYVTLAKKQVAFDCGIDFLAGPTEIVYCATEGNAEFIASDLVAQAEHDPEALCIFVTASTRLAKAVVKHATDMAKDNPIAKQSLAARGVVLVAKSRKQALEWTNELGGEHVSVPSEDVYAVKCAGSIFLGDYTAQSLGDYASGPNHTLPTGNVARYRGGLNVMDFVRIITIQEANRKGLEKIAPTVTLLAEAEGLKGHAASVRVRLKK
ncbi:MAG: histidinol dehydrogenase [Acidobacteria bacterium]|nr:MAG: histidinol dehydrogenase [Acidobacteriota bacterium]